MFLAANVHTTGVNIELVLTIVGSTVVIITAIFGVFAKVISNRITTAIDKFRIDVIFQLDNRLTKLEAIATATRKRQTRDD
jgi:hypothetical protein